MLDQPVEIDAGVVRLAVDLAAGLAVAERADAGHAAIGIEVAELRGLRESRRGCGRSRRPTVNWLRPRRDVAALGELAEGPPLCCDVSRAIDQAVALLGRLVVEQHVARCSARTETACWRRRRRWSGSRV